MKRIIAILLLLLVSAPSSLAGQESAEEIAKRVIADKSSAITPLPFGPIPISCVPPRNPGDDQLDAAAKQAREAIETYMLGDSVSEKVRIAYAIRVLAGKRIPTSGSPQIRVVQFDNRKNDQFLKDALILAARLAEIEEAERRDSEASDASTQPVGEAENEH